MDYMTMIRNVANLVADDELIKLRLEEELLINLVKKARFPLESKKRIMDRIKEINKLQIEMLGG